MNRFAVILFKILLFALMSWFIINQLFLKNDFNTQLTYFLNNLKGNRLYLFIAVLFLMPVNWGLETIKWRMLLRAKTPLLILLQSIIAGITVGFVTPGRSGEFVGRVMFLNEGNKSKVFYLSSIGGLAQTAASLVIGVPFIYLWRNDLFLAQIVTGCALVYLLAFFRFDILNRLLSKWSFLQRYGLLIEHGDLPDIQTQVRVLVLSMLRFAVYLFQYVLLLIFFGVGTNMLDLFTHSVAYLLAQTFSPLMPILDFSFRGATALYVFKDFSNNNIAVLTTVMLVWLINLVIPAVMGYLFILKRKEVKMPWLKDTVL